MSALPAEILEGLFAEPDRMLVPFWIQGRLVSPLPIPIDALERAASAAGPDALRDGIILADSLVLVEPRYCGDAAADRHRFVVLPRADPNALIERDLGVLARGLYSLPFVEVMRYVGALRDVLRASSDSLAAAARRSRGVASQDARSLELIFRMLPELFDPDALAVAADSELGGRDAPGRDYLDGWVEVRSIAVRGATARFADRIEPAPMDMSDTPSVLRVRATPTRQLHITAGNSPLIPVLSLLRALGSKGAAVIKAPAQALVVVALLGAAMRAVDPEHPITRHSSFTYWRGGDREVEDVLFSSKAFDRLVVWGSPDTIDSVASRARHVKIVALNPRYGLSLIGQEAFPDHVDAVARRAAADSMIGNQAACAASLVHYVEGSEEQVLEYCGALLRALSTWDRAAPQRRSRAELGRLRRLQRGQLARGAWFANGTDGEISSAVVYVPQPFDPSLHPMPRCIFVRRVDCLERALLNVTGAVSTVGVFPEAARLALRDALAAQGVSNIRPLGDCERSAAGIPHDGMRILGELVQWTCA